MINLNKKRTLISLLIGLFIFTICVTSIDAQRNKRRTKSKPVSKQTQIDRYFVKGVKEIQANQFSAAIETFTKCIALKPVLQSANDCYFGRGLSYFSISDFENAIPDFDKAYRSVVDNHSVYMRGRSYFELKKYDDAFRDFNLVINLSKEENIKKLSPEVYAFRGVILAGRGELDKAINDYTKTIELEPKYTDAYFSRGIAYELKGDFDNAEKDLKKALELNPSLKKDVDEVLQEIDIKKQNNANKTPKTEIKDAAIFGGTANETLAKGDDARERGDFVVAVGYYTICLKVEELNADCLNNRMVSYLKLNQTDNAIKDLSTMIENDIKKAEALGMRGFVYVQTGKFDPATQDFTKQIELEPKNAIAHNSRGIAYAQLKKYPEAIADFAKAVELDSFDRNFKNNLIVYNIVGKNYDEALRLTEKYSREKMLDATFPYLRAITYVDMKEYKKAIEQFDISLRLNPTKLEAYSGRANAFCQIGEKTKAKSDEKLVLEAGGKILKPCQ